MDEQLLILSMEETVKINHYVIMKYSPDEHWRKGNELTGIGSSIV